MDDQQIETVFAYLREHSARYSLEVLREQLVRGGYDPARVDEAMAAYQSEHPPAARPHVFPKALLVVAVNAVLLGIIIHMFVTDKSTPFSIIWSFVILLGAELVGGIVACFPVKSRPWGLALLLGFVLSIGLGILALGGFCLFLVNGPPHG